MVGCLPGGHEALGLSSTADTKPGDKYCINPATWGVGGGKCQAETPGVEWEAFPASPTIAPSISQLGREMGIFVAPIPMSLCVLSIISESCREGRSRSGSKEEERGNRRERGERFWVHQLPKSDWNPFSGCFSVAVKFV